MASTARNAKRVIAGAMKGARYAARSWLPRKALAKIEKEYGPI